MKSYVTCLKHRNIFQCNKRRILYNLLLLYLLLVNCIKIVDFFKKNVAAFFIARTHVSVLSGSEFSDSNKYVIEIQVHPIYLLLPLLRHQRRKPNIYFVLDCLININYFLNDFILT